MNAQNVKKIWEPYAVFGKGKRDVEEKEMG